LTEEDKALVLSQVAFHLCRMGRLTESIKPMRLGLRMSIKQQKWKNASACAMNLSELELTLGDIDSAGDVANDAVTYAVQSGDAFLQLRSQTTLADAWHQAGREIEALSLFSKAEKLHADAEPDYPLLYSQQGFQYCDLLLSQVERASWCICLAAGNESRGDIRASAQITKICSSVKRRATRTLKWAARHQLGPLTLALHEQTLACAAFYHAVLADPPPSHSPANC